MNVVIGTVGIEITSMESQNTIIVLSQLELFAVLDMINAAAAQTDGRLSHDLIGFGSAIAEPIKAKLSNAMEGIAGEYHEPEEFIIPAEMHEKIDSIITNIFGNNSNESVSKRKVADDENPPEKGHQPGQRRILPDDN